MSNSLEQEFQKLFKKVNPKINKELNKAQKLLEEAEVFFKKAEEIAEKEGVPFFADCKNAGYFPKSFVNSKFNDLDPDVVMDITGVYTNEDLTSPGYWQSSSDLC